VRKLLPIIANGIQEKRALHAYAKSPKQEHLLDLPMAAMRTLSGTGQIIAWDLLTYLQPATKELTHSMTVSSRGAANNCHKLQAG
jgi:hypothetical protein